jgi:hypothetical protein
MTDEDDKLSAAKQRRELEEKIDRDDRLTPAMKTIARELLRRVNRESGYAWPSAPKLAKIVKVSKRSVQYALPMLVQLGYFAAERRRGKTTLYTPVHTLPKTPYTSANFAVHQRKKRPWTRANFAPNLTEGTHRSISLSRTPEKPYDEATAFLLAEIMKQHGCSQAEAAAIFKSLGEHNSSPPPPEWGSKPQEAVGKEMLTLQKEQPDMSPGDIRNLAEQVVAVRKAERLAALAAGRDRLRKAGVRPCGSVPYWEGEPAAVILVKQLREQTNPPLSLRAIAEELERQGHLNRKGRRYSPSNIKEMVEGRMPPNHSKQLNIIQSN